MHAGGVQHLIEGLVSVWAGFGFRAGTALRFRAYGTAEGTVLSGVI